MTTPLPTGFYPFWFWNDRLSADEVRWQVAEMAWQGVRGFFIHSRQGLGQPYLSEAFFEMVDVAVAAAEAHGLVVHLYDEYPYPSGVAGGQVTLGQPRFHATELIQRTYDVPGGPISLALPRGKVLSVVAFPLVDGRPDWRRGIDLAGCVGPVLVVDSYRETGLTRYNQKRYFASRPTPILETVLPDEPHRIFTSVQSEVTHHKYWGHYADVLNPEAVAEFMQQTHERYYRRYGEKFGKSIRSIFVDETQPGWSVDLPAAFRQEYGYDLIERLPALQDESHPEHVRVAYDLHRLRYKRFCQSWEEPISDWCRAHGIGYSGEKPSLRMAQLRYMDIPGCEPGHTKAGAPLDLLGPHLRQNAKATASAAYFYGKAGSLDECYHSLGWSGTLQDAKLMADGQLLAGIRLLVPHGFFYSTHALRKHDAPPTFFFQTPYWPLFGKLAEHVERIGQLFEDTYIDAEILVIEPSSGIPSRADLEAYVQLQTLLMGRHLDFHFADTDILESGRIEAGVLRVADLAVRLVIVPPMRVIEEPLADWLARFEASGGRVLRCAHYLSADGRLADEALQAEIDAVVRPSLSVRKNGEDARSVQVVKRAGTERTLWFVLNTGSEPLTAELDAGRPLKEIPLEAGRSTQLELRAGRYVREVAAFESFMLEASALPVDSGWRPTSLAAQDAAEGVPRSSMPVVCVPLRGPARVRPLHPNLLRLAEWQMSILEDGAPLQTARVPALPLSDQLERGGFRFAPRVHRYFGHEPELDWPAMDVRYECAFENAFSGPIAFVMEPGSISGDWRLWVNAAGPLSACDLSETHAHVRGSLGVDITTLLRPGSNILRVEIAGARPEGGLLNPLYLAGEFGVTLSPPRLCERQEEGGFETYEANGLPYFSGAIEYALEFALPPAGIGLRARHKADTGPAGQPGTAAVQFVTDAPFHEACEVSLNGGPWRVLAWEPRALELPATELRPGRNRVRIRVYTTLIRAFEAQWFDTSAHCYREVG